MANLLLGATGSVAAIRVPELYRRLRLAGHAVKVVTTRAALYFFDPAALDAGAVVRDEDEWPGRDEGRLWRRDDSVLHIELRRWADLFAVAPLDANTLAKLANGLCDNCLTCVWRAWDTARPVVLAPAMNTLMWRHPLTARHLRQLAADCGGGDVPIGLDLDAVVRWVNERCPRLRVVGPQSKRLACGDVGEGAMADVADIVAACGLA
ncbi:MAG TPA: flavoprotein [Gemmataceae bacterium]|nr:flavoprotein [Gemmataceae bacterium]